MYFYLRENLNIPPDRIFLYGRSIGSGPSCYLAENHEVAGVILHSPIMSALRVVFNLRFTLPFDRFPNIDRVSRIDSPVFIIHGKRDEIVPFYHAQELHSQTKYKYPPYYVDGAGHNNVEKYANDYLLKIREFIYYVDQLQTKVAVSNDGEEGDHAEDMEERKEMLP